MKEFLLLMQPSGRVQAAFSSVQYGTITALDCTFQFNNNNKKRGDKSLDYYKCWTYGFCSFMAKVLRSRMIQMLAEDRRSSVRKQVNIPPGQQTGIFK